MMMGFMIDRKKIVNRLKSLLIKKLEGTAETKKNTSLNALAPSPQVHFSTLLRERREHGENIYAKGSKRMADMLIVLSDLSAIVGALATLWKTVLFVRKNGDRWVTVCRSTSRMWLEKLKKLLWRFTPSDG